METNTGKRVLVIGSGGREHAICWKLSQSPLVQAIHVLPGSEGISSIARATCVTHVNAKDFKEIVVWCRKHQIDMVVVGPEDPLANGIADELTSAGIPCFGPTRAGARIEADKSWAKAFMVKHNIPTAKFKTFSDTDSAKDFIRSASFDALVVKASGLAAGKGVIVAEDIEEACSAVDEILGSRKFGDAGDVIVVEEKMSGEEISVLAFVDGVTVRVMLPAQDHKRLGNEDQGPNTGGMGAYCPCPLISDDELAIVVKEVLERAVLGMKKEGISYCGVLYAGIMLTPNGPKTLEFNCRFGDPETQVLLPLLETDLFDVMWACCERRLSDVQIQWRKDCVAAGVVMASKGYPETAKKGCRITGIEAAEREPDQLIFHSGTSRNADGAFVTNGGRVLIAVALDKKLKIAAERATRICRGIEFEGAQYRTDIAAKAFINEQLSYKASGVDIEAGNAFVQKIKPLARGTYREGVLGSLGGFSGLFRLNKMTYKNRSGQDVNYEDPVLVQGTDGVGTKLKIAMAVDSFDTIGIDLVAMCANDVLCAGAEPFAFLDYIACGKLDVHTTALIVQGIAEGCRETKCALLGGETAEMPTLYAPGKYDLAGYCVGIVEHSHTLPKLEAIVAGDLIVGLPSSGLHSNGFSLVNRVMDVAKEKFSNTAPFSQYSWTFGQEYLTPTRLYVSAVLPLIRQGCVKALAHITGGGLMENVPRVLPAHLGALLDANTFGIQPVFGWLAAKGNVSDAEMLRTFNCGIGMVMVVGAHSEEYQRLANFGARVIGKIIQHNSESSRVIIENFTDAISIISRPYRIETVIQAIPISYKDSGVDIVAGDDLVHKIKQLAQSTCRPGVIGSLGGFAGLFRLKHASVRYKDPILVLGTDGVGTKLKIAQMLNKHDTIGIDLVAMCANDVACTGAEAQTFLDYYACGRLEVAVAYQVIAGIADGCKQSGSALVGGETAEMPGMYAPGIYDLAGFSLGIVEHAHLLPKLDNIRTGDILIGLPSSGIHSNGFSMVHKIMEMHKIGMNDKLPYGNRGKSFGDELLTPTKIYTKAVSQVVATGFVHAIAHITGGGLSENLPRVLPNNVKVALDARSFSIPPMFAFLADKGNVNAKEMLRTFNCGIGLVFIVSASGYRNVLRELYDHGPLVIGKVVDRQGMESQVDVHNFVECLSRVQRNLLTPKKRVAVLISGNGSNLQALIDATNDNAMGMNAEIVLVLSNKPKVFGLERAVNHDIPHQVIKHRDYSSRDEFDNAITAQLDKHSIEIVCLAGFMRILSNSFVRRWKGRLINIHPSLLPKFTGIDAQRQTLEAQESESGCTVHFVDEGVDTGAIIVQEVVPVKSDDTLESLTERILRVEHRAFPKALRLLATGAITLSPNGNTQWH